MLTASRTDMNVTADINVTASFADAGNPTVAVLIPNGGEFYAVGQVVKLSWSASDNVGVTGVDIYLSRSGVGGPFETIALNEANDGTYVWTATLPATEDAYVKIVARDANSNQGEILAK